jgi:hypothetical protein
MRGLWEAVGNDQHAGQARPVQQQVHKLVENHCIHQVPRREGVGHRFTLLGDGNGTLLYLFLRLVTMLTRSVRTFAACR